LCPRSGPPSDEGWGEGVGGGGIGWAKWVSHGRPCGSDHRAPLPPPSLPCLDGASPRPELLPREEWAKATPPPSLPAPWVVLVVSSGGGMVRMRRRGGGDARVGGAPRVTPGATLQLHSDIFCTHNPTCHKHNVCDVL
jgi:hypothetical protein